MHQFRVKLDRIMEQHPIHRSSRANSPGFFLLCAICAPMVLPACAKPQSAPATRQPQPAQYMAHDQQTTTAPALSVGERIVNVPRKIIEGALDPTGVRGASTDIGRASDELARKLKELDIDAANATLWQLQETIGIVRGRIESIPLDLGPDVRAQVQAARLSEISDQMQSIAREIRTKVDEVRIDQLNEAVSTIGSTVKNIDAKVAELDLAAVNKLVGGSQKGVDQTNSTLASAGLPLHVALWLTNAVLLSLLLCALVYLRRQLRQKN